jgi:hypothetical protein
MREHTVARIQAVYFLLTAVWPFVHVRSFLAVTGPKRDLWLVHTVGLLVGAIGAGLWRGARGERVPDEVVLTATAAAGSLAGMDVVQVARGRVRWTYLLDAVAELALLEAWRRARWPRS